MAYDKSYIREYAQIQGIHLLENMIIRLDNENIKMESISNEWTTRGFPLLNEQIRIISSVCADKIAARYLVHRLNLLNDHMTCEHPHRKYAKKLSKEAMFALNHAIESHTHIWDKVKRQAIQTAFGTAHVVKSKGLPYYDYEEEEEEEGEIEVARWRRKEK